MNESSGIKTTLNTVGINLLTSRFMSRLMRSVRDQVVPVFMLHRMADPSRGVTGHSLENVERALQYIASHDYQVVSVSDVVAAVNGHMTLPQRAVAFSLDDGFYDQGRFALPLFERYRMPVTLFLATDLPDLHYWPWECKLEWIISHTTKTHVDISMPGMVLREPLQAGDHKTVIRKVRSHLKLHGLAVISSVLQDMASKLGVEIPEQAPPAYESITWDEARALESKYVQFAPHSQHHVILSRLTTAQAEAEITGSWARIRQELRNPAPVFCYPNGRYGVDFSAREQTMAQSAGLLGAFSADAGYVEMSTQGQTDPFALRRFAFPDNLAIFRQYCSWLERGKDFLPGRTDRQLN